jgi:hypothetical protein
VDYYVRTDTLVWGLWRRNLLAQLLWVHTNQTQQPKINTEWRALSWSWTQQDISAANFIHMLREGEGEGFAFVEEIDVDVSPAGESRCASLNLRGCLVHATMTYPPENCSWYVEGILFEFEGIAHPILRDGSHSSLDHPCRERGLTAKFVCIAVHRDSDEEGLRFRNARTGVLILQQACSQPIKYKRPGVLFVDNKDFEFYTSQESSEEHTISIICYLFLDAERTEQELKITHCHYSHESIDTCTTHVHTSLHFLQIAPSSNNTRLSVLHVRFRYYRCVYHKQNSTPQPHPRHTYQHLSNSLLTFYMYRH